MNTNTNTNILRLPDVMARTGLSRSSIYAYIRRGLFPKPIELGPRARGWVEGGIEEWIIERIEKGSRPPESQKAGGAPCP